jgi:UDP-N-acetyl-2-amino-2-deoxyglucuronate dehydrogenase
MAVHIGIIGAGNISETHARAAKQISGVEIAAVYGQNLQKASRLARLYGGTVYESLEKMLEHRPMDLVLIASPSGLHAEQGILAARRGLHVLVEKPIDITPERADLLIEECERAGVKLGVFFQDRVKPDICKLKELVDSNRLGKLILVSARIKWYRSPEYYSESKWRGTWALDGGGALMNQGIHTVDLLLWLLGDVSRVYAKAVTAMHKIEAEDTVVAVLEFSSGTIGTLEATTAAFPGYPRRLELTGSEGTIILEHDRIVSTDLRSPISDFKCDAESDRNPSASSPIISDVRGHTKVLEDFLRAIETDGRPCCDGQQARRSVSLVQAIYESSRMGRPVTTS